MVTITPKAMLEIRRLKAGDPSLTDSRVRVLVMGGGCSGMSYKLDFDKKEATSSDKVFQFEDIQLVIDSKSFLFLTGTELDFSDGLNGKGFIFNNPNAKRTCGCGESFSV